MDKMLSKLIVVFSLFFLLLFMYGILINVHKIEENRCKMTYMYEYPQFVKISFPQNDNFPSYGLYAYSEGQMTEIARNMEFSGAPILFIPGNAGSFKQVRSLASVALRKSIDNGWRHHVDYFTVDLSEQYSGLYGGVLNTQVEYVQLCVKHILGLYERFKNGPKTIILIGHSLGGKIAQSVAASPGMATHINSIIAISSPVDFPVLSMDHYYQQFYTATNEQWRLNRTTCRDDDCRTQYAGRKKTLDHILLLTIGGGIRDTMVHDALTSSVFSDVHAMIRVVSVLVSAHRNQIRVIKIPARANGKIIIPFAKSTHRTPEQQTEVRLTDGSVTDDVSIRGQTQSPALPFKSTSRKYEEERRRARKRPREVSFSDDEAGFRGFSAGSEERFRSFPDDRSMLPESGMDPTLTSAVRRSARLKKKNEF